MSVELSHHETRAIESLQRLAKRWPDSLWLFSGSGRLCVMKKNEHGLPARLDGREGGVDPAYDVATINIENDGGDWD